MACPKSTLEIRTGLAARSSGSELTPPSARLTARSVHVQGAPGGCSGKAGQEQALSVPMEKSGFWAVEAPLATHVSSHASLRLSEF